MPYIALDSSAATQIDDPTPNPAEPLENEGITLAVARDEIIAMLAGNVDIPPARIDFWLNRAYIDLCTSAKIDELKGSLSFNTVADQPLYLLPTITLTTIALGRVDDSFEEGGVPLDKIDLSAYRRRKTITGFPDRAPTEFFRMNRLLVLYPTPSEAFEMILDFRFEPILLTEDNHSPILRSEWHEAWITLARKKILSANAEWEASMALGNELASHMTMRQDHEAGEDENRIVSTSRPRNHRQLRRRGNPPRPLIDD